MQIRVRVSGDREFTRLAARLRGAATELPIDLRVALMRASPAAVTRVRAAVLASEFPVVDRRGNVVERRSSRPGRTGLRARLARGVRADPRATGAGVRFTVDGAAVGERGHRMAVLTDGEIEPRWRSPTFGRTETRRDQDGQTIGRSPWKQQRGSRWFFATLRAQEPLFRSAVERGMAPTVDRIVR